MTRPFLFRISDENQEDNRCENKTWSDDVTEHWAEHSVVGEVMLIRILF